MDPNRESDTNAAQPGMDQPMASSSAATPTPPVMDQDQAPKQPEMPVINSTPSLPTETEAATPPSVQPMPDPMTGMDSSSGQSADQPTMPTPMPVDSSPTAMPPADHGSVNETMHPVKKTQVPTMAIAMLIGVIVIALALYFLL